MDSEFDYVFKLILVGDCAVGKSSLILRFADDTFFENYAQTIAIDLKIRTIKLGGKVIKLQIWDTSGEERYRSITSNYYRGAHGVIAVYDVTKRQTFDHINEWFSEVDRYTKDNAQKLLLGNKCDLVKEKAVDPSVAKRYADGLGIQFLETSAKDSANVEQAFETMATQILTTVESEALKSASPSVNIDPKTKPVESFFYSWC